jgi:hypothetical protein
MSQMNNFIKLLTQNQALSFGVPEMCGKAVRLGKVDESLFGFSRILDDFVTAQGSFREIVVANQREFGHWRRWLKDGGQDHYA